VFLNAQDIIAEVNRRANELNYQVQLYALELYQKEYFKPKHFSGNDHYSELHKEVHRIKKAEERWIDFYGEDVMQNFFIRREKIEEKIQELKSERKAEREGFVLDFITK